jgi:hypothetical protein
MKKKFDYFEPAGPLRYLLMNRNNLERLGIYKNRMNDKLVLIFTCYDKSYVMELAEEMFEKFMQNKFSIKQLIKISPLKKISGENINTIERIKFRFYLLKYLNGTLSEQKHLQVYPNFYYVWRKLLWEDNKMKNNRNEKI